jgi:hypothetical protein
MEKIRKISKNLEEAEMALEMFNARHCKQDEAQDYIDEA